MYTIKKRRVKNTFLSKTFNPQPVSIQSSFKINLRIEFAILEEIILVKLSILLFLIPPTNLTVLFFIN